MEDKSDYYDNLIEKFQEETMFYSSIHEAMRTESAKLLLNIEKEYFYKLFENLDSNFFLIFIINEVIPDFKIDIPNDKLGCVDYIFKEYKKYGREQGYIN